MNTIYLPVAVIIALLFYYRYKSDCLNKEQDESELTKEIHSFDNNIKPEVANQIVPDTSLVEIKPKIVATRNSYLYPEDDFGKLEKGVVSDSVNYVYDLNENKSDDKDLVILSEKKHIERNGRNLEENRKFLKKIFKMDENQLLTYYITQLRGFLKKNSINENTSKKIEFILNHQFTYITSLTFKKKIYSFLRLTVNKRVNDDKSEKTIEEICKLKYRKDGAQTNGRANLIGDRILYGTDNIISALKEARVENNNVITISTWKLKDEKLLTITPIFKNFPFIYNEAFNIDFIELHKEYLLKINQNETETRQNIDLFVNFLSDCFSKDVDSNNHYDYFLSSFYANRLFNFLQNGEIDCILFPSVQDDLLAINIAMKHDVFDNNYELEKVEEKRVSILPTGKNSYCELIPIKESISFSKNQINW